MKNATRIMVDIETLGTEPGAVIVSIGAVEFGPEGVRDETYVVVRKESCTNAGLEIDEETVEWWEDRSDEAREALSGGVELIVALEHLAEFVDGADEVWANSPSFDCRILEHAYDLAEMELPWSFWQERDYRTLQNLPVAVDVEQEGEPHHALDDARYQAESAAATLRALHDVEAASAGGVE
jgi:DNA polymerase III epsilon subunit-like protein